MKVMHLLLVVEHSIRKLVSLCCRPAGTFRREPCDIRQWVSIPAQEHCDTAVWGRSCIAVLAPPGIAGEENSDILGSVRFCTALEAQCCKPGKMGCNGAKKQPMYEESGRKIACQ